MLVCHQCDCQFVSDHIVPVAIKLVYDRVAHVRNTATNFVSTIIMFSCMIQYMYTYVCSHYACVCVDVVLICVIGRVFALYSWK